MVAEEFVPVGPIDVRLTVDTLLADGPMSEPLQSDARTSAKRTQRYMHLSPAAIDSAIRLLDVAHSVAQPAMGIGNSNS